VQEQDPKTGEAAAGIPLKSIITQPYDLSLESNSRLFPAWNASGIGGPWVLEIIGRQRVINWEGVGGIDN